MDLQQQHKLLQLELLEQHSELVPLDLRIHSIFLMLECQHEDLYQLELRHLFEQKHL